MWREDGAVGIVVEIFRADDEGDFIARFRQKEQAADDCPLGFNRARRLAVEKFADGVVRRCAVFFLPWPLRFDPSIVRLEWERGRMGEGETMTRNRPYFVSPSPYLPLSPSEFSD